LQTHPIHLHGHDFYVLGQKASATYSGTSDLNFSNPIRRDVAMLPASGYLVMGFPTDNPGVWLLHCHVSLCLIPPPPLTYPGRDN
jgi:FtsP/CotA-like multicopper oxidase with cupredoxin domain